MDLELAGKAAIVTGGSRGIGKAIARELARESGFLSVKDLLGTAKHGRGNKIYLIRFHYLPPGGWDVSRTGSNTQPGPR